MRIYSSVAIVALCVASTHVTGQERTGDAKQAFEVASVRAIGDEKLEIAPGTSMTWTAERFVAQGVSLQSLLALAYGTQEFRISGGPRWMRTNRFSIEAKPQTAVDDRVMLLMLRSLLADRFGVSLHSEMKDMPAHVLLLAKKGPALQPTRLDPSEYRRLRVSPPKGIKAQSSSEFQLSGTASMSQLAAYLSLAMRGAVVDGTGLDGIFDVDVQFSSETFAPSIKGHERDALVGVASPNAPFDPFLADALRTQLGVRVETQRRPIELLVIDSASLPAEN